MRIILAMVVAVILSACAVAPYQVSGYFKANAFSAADGKTIAVLPFRGGAGPDVTDIANLEFGRLNRYKLVERVRVEELYAEQDFDPERVDDETAAKIGKMLGAKAVVLGQVYEYTRGRAGVSMRLVDTETGEHLWQSKDTIEATNVAVRELAKDRYDSARIRKDPDALTSVLVRAMVETISR